MHRIGRFHSSSPDMLAQLLLAWLNSGG